jgi:hypothetical protein
MEALLTIAGIVAVLVVFGALSVAIGTDSRDGYTDSPARPTFH